MRRVPTERTSDDKEQLDKRLFFDLLPDDTNKIIPRHFSWRPREKTWTMFISDADIAILYGGVCVRSSILLSYRWNTENGS